MMRDGYEQLRRWLRTAQGGDILDDAMRGRLTENVVSELLEDFDIGPTPANRQWFSWEIDLARAEGF